MSTLNINELRDLAYNHNLLGSNFLEKNFQPSSYDLRIGSIFKDGKIISSDFKESGFTNCVEFKPSEITSMLTLEKVTIPTDCIGTVFAMNSLSSEGFLILNPGHIDPGYSGHLSVCAINLSKEIKTLSIGDPVFTLIVQKLSSKLPDDQSYLPRNITFESRKEEEQTFHKNKSRKLSHTFFDLITSYDDGKKMLGEKIWNWFLRKLGRIAFFLAGAAGVISVFYLIAPDYMPVFKKAKTEQLNYDSAGNSNSAKPIQPQVSKDSLKQGFK